MTKSGNYKRIGFGLLILIVLAVLYTSWCYFQKGNDNEVNLYHPPEIYPSDSSVLYDHPIQVVVHRVANYMAPENTYVAAAECIRLGVDYVEIDVRISKDGIHYVIHDKTLDRTTNGEGPVNEKDSNYIDQLDAGSWFDEKYISEPVPRLKEYLKWIKGKAKVYLDIKSVDLPVVVEMIRMLDMEDEVFFWFRDDNLSREFNQLAPDLTLKLAAWSLEELKRAITEFDADIIECGLELLTPEMISLCRDHKVRIMTKGGDNTPELVNLDRPYIYVQTLYDSLNKLN
jgi:glycerophosphoryl diester phosphodiesterase